MQHTSAGGFPSLQLEGIANLPPFWLNLNNQGHPNVSAISVQIVRAREAGLKLLAIQLSDARWYFTYDIVTITSELLVTRNLQCHVIWYVMVYFDRLHVVYDS